MLCQKCKSNEALVTYKEVVNDSVTELRLCKNCAAEKDEESVQGTSSGIDLLTALAGQVTTAAKKKVHTKSCPECLRALHEVEKQGRLGCGRCYVSFKEELLPILQKGQKGMQHVGKAPKLKGDAYLQRQQMMKLRHDLQAAVTAENYEEAARLRDQISLLETSQHGQKRD